MNCFKSKKRLILIVCACLLLCIGIIGGISAYMTNTDFTINKVTIGDVEIKAWEPSWPTTDEDEDGVPDEAELLIPYETVTKDPRIKNTGENDAIVFFKVTSPVEELTLITDEGTREDTAVVDLFWFKQADDSEDSHENNFNENWIEIDYGDMDRFVEDEDINNNKNDENEDNDKTGYVYIFGYHVRLAEDETTETLFDKFQNKKYGSRTIEKDEIETIKIEAYAIQADDIYKDGEVVDTTGELSQETLTYIYNVFFNQNKELLGGDGD